MTKMRTAHATIWLLAMALAQSVGSSRLLAQDTPSTALPPLIEEAEEMALALSAAPAHVSGEAALLVLRRGGFTKVRDGTNGFTCIVDRFYVEALEPMCFNREGSETILPVLLRRNELREQGRSPGEIDQEIEPAFQRGELPLPHGLAIAYMFSSRQRLITDAGQDIGSYVPHLMIYVPYLTPEALGGQARRPSDPAIFRAARREAALIVPVRADFVDPAS